MKTALFFGLSREPLSATGTMFTQMDRSRPLWRPWEEGGLTSDADKAANSRTSTLALSLSFALPTQVSVFPPTTCTLAHSRLPPPPSPLPPPPATHASWRPLAPESEAAVDYVKPKQQLFSAPVQSECQSMPMLPPDRLLVKCEPVSAPSPALDALFRAVCEKTERQSDKTTERAAHLRAVKREPPLTIVTTVDEVISAPSASTASSSSSASTVPLPATPTPQPPSSPTSSSLGPYSATLSPLDCLFYWQPDEVRDQMRVLYFAAVDGYFALATVNELVAGNVYATLRIACSVSLCPFLSFLVFPIVSVCSLK